MQRLSTILTKMNRNKNYLSPQILTHRNDKEIFRWNCRFCLQTDTHMLRC